MTDFETQLIQKLDMLISQSTNSFEWLKNLISTIVGILVGSLLTYFNQNTGTLICYIVSLENEYKKTLIQLYEM